MSRDAVGRALASTSYAWAAAALTVLLLIVNTAVTPSFLALANWPLVLAAASPFMITAFAQAFAVLPGNGGLDLSIGPFTSFITVLIAAVLASHGLSSPEALIPAVLAVGLVAGLVTGVLIAYLRLPAIIVTLGTYLFYTGIAPEILPSPGGTVPGWLDRLAAGSVGHVPEMLFVFAALACGWFVLCRTAYVRNVMAVGGDVRAAYTAGVNIALVQACAYALAGLLAALAGLVLAGVIQSGDATVGTSYTLSSVAAVALGGISLAGGRGGLFGAALGGAVLFLIQNLLTAAHVSVFQLQIVDGVILVFALAANGLLDRARRQLAMRAARTESPGLSAIQGNS